MTGASASRLRSLTASAGERRLIGDDRSNRARIAVVALYGVLTLSVAGYLVLLIVRRTGSYSELIDGWFVDGVEFVASLLCLARALVPRPGRLVALSLGCALLCWCVGDVVTTLETVNGVSPRGVTAANPFYLGFYPLAYIAVVGFMRSEVRSLSTPSWLDGVIAGLGAAALCAAFAFGSVLRFAGGNLDTTIVNLAYPIGDLLLLGLVVGATAMLGGPRRLAWTLIGAGLALNVLGDTANLFQHSLGNSWTANTFNAIAWPASIVLMSIAVWLRPGPSDPLARGTPPGFVLPEAAASCALAVLIVGTLQTENHVALALAAATLGVVGMRLALSVRGLRSLSEERRHQSITDELTGLGNRRYLFDVLDAFFAENGADPSGERSLAFLYIDLNGFKEVNDSFGHPAGDELLRQLGPRFARGLRSTDAAVRIGGDEFAIVLVDADVEHAHLVAERVTESLRAPFLLGSVQAAVGASIGIAVAPGDATDSASLVWCADVAMYRAKVGKVPIAIFEQQIDEEHNRLELASELREAIGDDQLLLHFQPQLDLQTGRFSAAEALVRWMHPRLGLLAPLTFLPIADETGLMGPLTDCVLDKALAQCARWSDAGTAMPVSVNISASNLLDPRFVETVEGLLQRHRVRACALALELTETSIISDLETSRRVIGALRELGVLVSIDDFGAGFTSLAHLNGLAVGELKLDRGFIAGLATTRNARDRELVRATIDLAHALEMRVVAEGVEETATLELLRTLGCDRAQGYVISMPRPSEELRLPATLGETTTFRPREHASGTAASGESSWLARPSPSGAIAR